MGTRHAKSYEVQDQPYLTFNPHTSSYEETPNSYWMSQEVDDTYASTSMTRPLPISRAYSRGPSIPPLYFESSRTSFTPSLEDEPISPLPCANLKRSSHIRRKERPQRQKNKARMSRRSLPPIITDFSSRISQQSTPPLSSTRRMHSPSRLSTSSPKGTPMRRDSNGDWPESPLSVYSAPSACQSATVYVEWDTTGYLQPEDQHKDSWKVPFEPEVEEGGALKRQKTAVIVDLLRARRQRAGMD